MSYPIYNIHKADSKLKKVQIGTTTSSQKLPNNKQTKAGAKARGANPWPNSKNNLTLSNNKQFTKISKLSPPAMKNNRHISGYLRPRVNFTRWRSHRLWEIKLSQRLRIRNKQRSLWLSKLAIWGRSTIGWGTTCRTCKKAVRECGRRICRWLSQTIDWNRNSKYTITRVKFVSLAKFQGIRELEKISQVYSTRDKSHIARVLRRKQGGKEK